MSMSLFNNKPPTIDQARRRSLCWNILHSPSELERSIALGALADLYTEAGLPTFGRTLVTGGLKLARLHAQQVLEE